MSDDKPSAYEVTRLSRIKPPDATQPPWLVEGLWARSAVGCIGGPPKSNKTWLALELALAVASGKPCLGRYAVATRGPVLIFCAEDGPDEIRARVAGLARARGVDFDSLAIGWITTSSLWLDDPIHRRRLTATVVAMKPRMLILDPLVRLHRSDENSAADVSDLLAFLRGLQRDHNVAIVLVHHVRKSAASEPGQGLRGSGDLHAWGDSNLYVVRRDGKPLLVAEHRARRAPPNIAIRLEGDPPRLIADDVPAEVPVDPLEQRIVAALTDRPITRTALRERLQVRNETLGAAIDRLVASGRVRRVDDGLVVPVPASGDRRERNEP